MKKCKICFEKTQKIKINLPFFNHLNFQTISKKIIFTKCLNCQLIFQSKLSSKFNNFFQKKDYSLSKQTDHKIFDINKKSTHRTTIQSKIISNFFKQNKLDVLDVGCFDGKLLKELSNNYRIHKMYGYDVNEHLKKKFPKKKNFYFIKQNITKIRIKFDLIIFSHSLGYIENLEKELKLYIKLLKKDGKIFIQIPNLERNPFYSLMGDQYQFFTKGSIINVFQNYDFKTKLIKNKHFPRELLFLSERKQKTNKVKMIKDLSFENSIKKIIKIKKYILRYFKLPIYVLGTTVNAAFIDEILSKKVIAFIDEKKITKKSTLRNKKIFHPNHLTKEDTTILPFSPESKDILHKFNVKFKGIFKLLNI